MYSFQTGQLRSPFWTSRWFDMADSMQVNVNQEFMQRSLNINLFLNLFPLWIGETPYWNLSVTILLFVPNVNQRCISQLFTFSLKKYRWKNSIRRPSLKSEPKRIVSLQTKPLYIRKWRHIQQDTLTNGTQDELFSPRNSRKQSQWL